jgi:hypothetical protein
MRNDPKGILGIWKYQFGSLKLMKLFQPLVKLAYVFTSMSLACDEYVRNSQRDLAKPMNKKTQKQPYYIH